MEPASTVIKGQKIMAEKQQPIYVGPQQVRLQTDRQDKPSKTAEEDLDPVLTLAKAWGVGKVA